MSVSRSGVSSSAWIPVTSESRPNKARKKGLPAPNTCNSSTGIVRARKSARPAATTADNSGGDVSMASIARSSVSGAGGPSPSTTTVSDASHVSPASTWASMHSASWSRRHPGASIVAARPPDGPGSRNRPAVAVMTTVSTTSTPLSTSPMAKIERSSRATCSRSAHVSRSEYALISNFSRNPSPLTVRVRSNVATGSIAAGAPSVEMRRSVLGPSRTRPMS